MNETNTVVICRLPKQAIGSLSAELSEPGTLTELSRCFQLTFMRRILAVFDTSIAAAAALPQIRSIVKQQPGCEDAHVGFSMHNTNNNLPENAHLHLPDTGRILFVSPPPSPPNGWVTSLEEEPNRKTHWESSFNEKLSSALAAASSNCCAPNCGIFRPALPVTDGSVSPHASLPCTPVSLTFLDSPRIVTIVPAYANSPGIQVTSDE